MDSKASCKPDKDHAGSGSRLGSTLGALPRLGLRFLRSHRHNTRNVDTSHEEVGWKMTVRTSLNILERRCHSHPVKLA